jgi:predicted transcriptional regulator
MTDMIEHTAAIVAAYASHNPVSADGLPAIIKSVNDALRQAGASAVEPEKVELIPAVSIKKSVTPDYIICLEDGKRFKSLKRHLMTHYDLTPDQYRVKWGLAGDYPMVAPAYASARSELAKKMGLGQRVG